MSHARETMSIDRAHPGLWDRLSSLIAWVAGAALFLSVGWTAMAPDDPLGPVSLLTQRSGSIMYVQAVALAAVAAGVGTLVAGRRLADMGPFAAALGMSAVALRGATSEYLLVHRSELSDSFERGLALSFMLESIAWFTAVIVVILVSAAVAHWCIGPRRTHASAPPSDTAELDHPIASGFDAPIVGERWFGFATGEQTAIGLGIRHTVIAAGVGVIVMAILCAGLSSRSIQHGQVYFVVAASVMLGVYFAYRAAPVRSAVWSILAVGAMALVGYTWAALRPGDAALPPNIPSSHFLRILPLQFIAVGTAAAVAGYWYVFIPGYDARTRLPRPVHPPSSTDSRR